MDSRISYKTLGFLVNVISRVGVVVLATASEVVESSVAILSEFEDLVRSGIDLGKK